MKEKAILSLIFQYLMEYQYKIEAGETTPDENAFYKVLEMCYDLLARTKLIKEFNFSVPKDQREPWEPKIENLFAINANDILDMLHDAITGDQDFPIDFRKILRQTMQSKISQVELADKVQIRRSTIGNYLNGRNVINADYLEKMLNYIKTL